MLAAGVYLMTQDGVLRLIGYVALALGVVALAALAISRRTRLIADPSGLTYQSWLSKQNVSWDRLSSLQFKKEPGRKTSHMVVVNDMGRSVVDVPVHMFDPQELHDWVEKLPTRSNGRSRLLK